MFEKKSCKAGWTSKTLKENLPKPYLWLVFKKYFLFEGILKSTGLIAMITLVDVLMFKTCHSTVVILGIFYWLANFLVNFSFIMSLKTAYNEDKDAGMEMLKSLFPQAEEIN